MGVIKGMGIIFDELSNIKVNKISLRKISVAWKLHSNTCMIFYVVNNIINVPGLKKLISKNYVTSIKLGKPDYHMLLTLADSILNENNDNYDITADMLVKKSLSIHNKSYFSTVSGALAILKKTLLCDKCIVMGEGIRDQFMIKNDMSINEMSLSILDVHNIAMSDAFLIARISPHSVTTLHAGNINLILKSPEKCIEFSNNILFGIQLYNKQLFGYGKDVILNDKKMLLSLTALNARIMMGQSKYKINKLIDFTIPCI